MTDQAVNGRLENAAVDEYQDQPKVELIFGVDDKPPIHIALFYGLQVSTHFALCHTLLCFWPWSILTRGLIQYKDVVLPV